MSDKDKRIIKTLHCDNESCDTRKLKKFVHFVSKKAMDIEGLAEGTLEKLIGRGLLHSFADIYELDKHREAILAMDGFGEKSWQNLWDAIQRSRNTTFERFLIAMDIPMIGSTASRTLANQFNSDLEAFTDALEDMYDFHQLPGIEEAMHNSIYQWFWNEENYCMWFELRELITIRKRGAA